MVDAQITTKDSAAMISGNGGAYIGSQTVQEILDTGFVKNYTLIAGCDGTIGKPEDGPGSFVMFTGIEEVEKSLPKIGDAIRIQYGDGYGPELSGADYAGTIGSKQQTETPVIFLPDWMAENLGVSPGETLDVYKRQELLHDAIMEAMQSLIRDNQNDMATSLQEIILQCTAQQNQGSQPEELRHRLEELNRELDRLLTFAGNDLTDLRIKQISDCLLYTSRCV